MITFSNTESHSVGEPSAIDPNATLVGAGVPQPQRRDVDLEALCLGVVSEGDSVLVALSDEARGHHGGTPGARLLAPVLPVASVHQGTERAWQNGHIAAKAQPAPLLHSP